jgi:hypothetical protein
MGWRYSLMAASRWLLFALARLDSSPEQEQGVQLLLLGSGSDRCIDAVLLLFGFCSRLKLTWYES